MTQCQRAALSQTEREKLPRMVDVDGYDRLELLGQGGFAVVYRAYQPSLDRYVALKVFLTEIDDSAGRKRFDREIRLLARVSDHPNIVSVLDSGFTRDGRPYLAMPLYTRGTLAGLLAEQGPMAYEGVLRIGVKLSSALTTLHDPGIVHGDIKPQNVLLNTYGEVALSDFGMARVIQSDEGEIGDLGFTPAYAPPRH